MCHRDAARGGVGVGVGVGVCVYVRGDNSVPHMQRPSPGTFESNIQPLYGAELRPLSRREERSRSGMAVMEETARAGVAEKAGAEVEACAGAAACDGAEGGTEVRAGTEANANLPVIRLRAFLMTGDSEGQGGGVCTTAPNRRSSSTELERCLAREPLHSTTEANVFLVGPMQHTHFHVVISVNNEPTFA